MATTGTHEAVVRMLAELAPRGRVLDLGCGEGALSLNLAKRGYEVWALDIARPSPRLQRAGIPFALADAEAGLPFADDSFDAVTCVEFIEHLSSPGRVLSDIARVLKPGGLAVLTTPNVLNLWSRLKFLLTGYHYTDKPLSRERAQRGMAHIMLLSPEHLIYMIEIAGLQVEAVCCSGFGRGARLLSPFAPLVRMLARRYHRRYRLPRRLEDIVLSPVCLYGRALVVAARVAQAV